MVKMSDGREGWKRGLFKMDMEGIGDGVYGIEYHRFG